MVEITIRKRPRSEAVVTQRKFFKKTAKGKVIKGSPTQSKQPCMALILLQFSENAIYETTSVVESKAAMRVLPTRVPLKRTASQRPRQKTIHNFLMATLSCLTPTYSYPKCAMSPSPRIEYFAEWDADGSYGIPAFQSAYPPSSDGS
jgi:hypothetical protein